MIERECPGHGILPVAEFGTKGKNRSGTPKYQRRCRACMVAIAAERRERSAANPPDPLGPDPLMPIQPFRDWLERLVDRRTRLQGFAIRRSDGRGGDQQTGALDAIGAELAAQLGGTHDGWCRKLYRWRVEGERVRLSAADALLTILDFDGTRVDDLWPLEDDEEAAA